MYPEMNRINSTTNNVSSMHQAIVRTLTSEDDIELVRGMPVGLQIVGGPFGEEKAVAIAKVIQNLSLHK